MTEEILGPVRNGGIASTYYHLSKGLAAHGHNVHVLFLKGPVVQDESPEHWVKHFAEFGVTLNYLDLPEYPVWGAATEWQRRYAAAYAWLRDEDPFDVVHTSEWRGGLVYALAAKRLGLAFRETLFLVKTSSPHIWNRHYQMRPIERRELVLASYAEQKCVELADAVIGGSAHLISFMDRIGYSLPETNVFVQPNIVDFSEVVVADRRPGEPRRPGDVVKSRDLVFFGRLEGRKGVELFCNAVEILRERGVSPDSVTFLGKWGAPLATQGGMTVQDYIQGKSQGWDFPVTVITDKNQPDALSYMCSRDMTAVMPSLIENSTMAVYEALEQRIPFVATAVGGTPELIDEVDHVRCLVEPKAPALADRLAQILEEGQVIARSSFSNDANLGVWYGFHSHVGEMIGRLGREQAVAQLTAGIDCPGPVVSTVAYAVLVRRDDRLDHLVAALRADPPDRVVLGLTDAAMRPEASAARAALAEDGVIVEVFDCIGQAAGDALNALMTAQACDAVVVAHGADVWPRPGFLAAARVGLGRQPGALFTTFFTGQDHLVGMPIGGDVASQFFTSRAYGPELVALRRDTFEWLGRFEPYDVRHGIVHDYVTRAAEAGRDLLVFPEELLVWPSAQDRAREFAEDAVYAYLKAKPLIDGSGLAHRKITLTALNQADRGGGALDERLLRESRQEDGTHWLMPVGWNRQDVDTALKRRLVVGLDEEQNDIWLYARGRGERRFTVRGARQPLEMIETHGEETDEDYLTLSCFHVPSTWDAGVSYPALWGLYQNSEKLTNLFLRINKIGADTFALAGRNPVLSVSALRELVDRQLKAARVEVAIRSTATLEPARPRDVPDLDGLLALARETGRAGLERESASTRSQRLLEELTQVPAVEPRPADVHAHLTSLQGDGGWVEGDWLVGWAWDRSDPDRVLHVAVVSDGEPVFVVAADAQDPSLDRTTPGLGRHGFRIPVLPEFLEVGGIRLEVLECRMPVAEGVLKVFEDEGPVLRATADEVPVEDDVDELVAMAVAAALRSAHETSQKTAEGPVGQASGREAVCARSRWLLERVSDGVSVGRDGAGIRSHLSRPPGGYGWAEGDWLVGWAWDRTDPDRMLHVAVVSDGEPVFVVVADAEEPSLDRTTPGLGRHGFRVPVLPEFLGASGIRLEVWEGRVPVREGGLDVRIVDETTVLRKTERRGHNSPALARDRSERNARERYEATRARSAALLAELPAGVTGLNLGGTRRKRLWRRVLLGRFMSGLAGARAPVDARAHLTPRPGGGGWAEGDWLAGWAWDRSDPDRVLRVAVVRDGRPVFMVAADTQDSRLDRKTPGLGRHGFRIPVLPEFLGSDRIRLEVWEGRIPVRKGVLAATGGESARLRQVSEEE
ncbi:MAG TPA: glycosyltransferase family 4 protein [Nocardioidaceae bacterium]|nr:glycosyltransferase family 4 protein [Nocardioidaceae bacterium]